MRVLELEEAAERFYVLIGKRNTALYRISTTPEVGEGPVAYRTSVIEMRDGLGKDAGTLEELLMGSQNGLLFTFTNNQFNNGRC